MCLQRKENFAKTFAIFFFLFFLYSAGHCADSQAAFKDAARHLVNSILARASFPAAVSLEIRNNSSLTAGEVAAVRELLAAEFAPNHAQIVATEQAVAENRITLAEDVR